MKTGKNPWLPWSETIRLAPLPDRGSVLVIIPTAGRDIVRLKKCLQSLRLAGRGTPIHPVVVLCPATVRAVRAAKAVCRDQAELISLPGPFNYCRSINTGLLHRDKADGYALFMNDDATFEAAGDLARLKQSLAQERWACVGPYIREWHSRFSAVAKTAGAVRTNEPVNGCCVLWDLKWLNRIGPLDEEFGVGWGLDEADLCLRVVRRGGAYGRNDAVVIKHAGHATFGVHYTAYAGAAHVRNLQYFSNKYGLDVGAWGQTHHWWPLPGVQVSIAAYNASRWFERCLYSVERALDGFRWGLFVGDDASRDETYAIALEHCRQHTSADVAVVRRFERKAMTVDQAKNRVLKLGMPFQSQYPAMCLMDADDEMGVNRIRHLLWQARDGGHRAVVGDYRQIAPCWDEEHNKIVQASIKSQLEIGFGPWATLFHANLVPTSGKLFREHKAQISNGDLDLWLRWYLKGIHFQPLPGRIVHRYYWHPGTVSRPWDGAVARKLSRDWAIRKKKLLSLQDRESVQATYSQGQIDRFVTGLNKLRQRLDNTDPQCARRGRHEQYSSQRRVTTHS